MSGAILYAPAGRFRVCSALRHHNLIAVKLVLSSSSSVFRQPMISTALWCPTERRDGEISDAPDSKSGARKGVPVRPGCL